MIGHGRFVRVSLSAHKVAKDLGVSQAPVTEEQEEERSPSEELERSVVQTVVVHRRLLEVVCEQELVANEQVEEREGCDGPQDWQGKAIHEGYEHRVQYSRVLEVHHDLRSAEECYILLVRDAGCPVSATASARITSAEEIAHAKHNGEVDVDEVGVEHHCGHDCRRDV